MTTATKPTTTATRPTTTATTSPLAGYAWTLDPAHTRLEFAVKHLMIHNVKGSFRTVSGRVRLNLDRPLDPEVEVNVDVASLYTADDRRDEHLRSADFFDAQHHPTMTFKGGHIEGDINGRFKLTGALTIRGTTRDIVLDVLNGGRAVDPWGNEKVAFSATGRVNRLDYGLKWNAALETGGVLVGDEVRISVEAEFGKL